MAERAGGWVDAGGIPLYPEADENTALITRDQLGAPKEKLKGSLNRLQNGLKSWINVNKSRKEQLGQSVEKCENIKERSSDVESLMYEASKIQHAMKETITRTTLKLNEQTEGLKDLDRVTKKVGEQMKEIAEWSPWTPPWALIYCTMACVLLAGAFMAIPFIVNAAGVTRIKLPKDPLGALTKTKSVSLMQAPKLALKTKSVSLARSMQTPKLVQPHKSISTLHAAHIAKPKKVQYTHEPVVESQWDTSRLH